MRVSIMLICGTLITQLGCTASIAPSHYRPTPLETQKLAYGGWVEVTPAGSAQTDKTVGELIAVSSDSIHVLDSSGLISLSSLQLRKVHLQAFDNRYGIPMVWTIIGTVSTVSHGFVLLISAPVWIITGSIATAAQSATGHEYADAGEIARLAPYARFPQGIPAGIDRRLLVPLGHDQL